MTRFAAVFCLILTLQYSYEFVVSDDGSQLVAVAVLYRDGDKTPSSSYPNDPYFDLSYWPMGFGQLTDVNINNYRLITNSVQEGEMRQYELGKWFRNRYDTFISEVYNASAIYVRSADTDRSLLSAQANLVGLFPPQPSQVGYYKIQWQLIPVHTLPIDEDQVLYMERPCPKFNRLYDEVRNGELFQTVNSEFAEFYREVSELTGWDIDDVDYFYTLQGILAIYSRLKPSYLPSWYSSLDMDKVRYLAGLSFARYTFTDDLKRLGDGPFFDYLLSNFDRVLDGTQQTPKFLMLSGLESTIASVLNGMRLFDYTPPMFASSLIWELRKDADGGLFVNLLYKINNTDAAQELVLPGCSYNCNYQIFKSILSPIAMDLPSWEAECAETN